MLGWVVKQSLMWHIFHGKRSPTRAVVAHITTITQQQPSTQCQKKLQKSAISAYQTYHSSCLLALFYLTGSFISSTNTLYLMYFTTKWRHFSSISKASFVFLQAPRQSFSDPFHLLMMGIGNPTPSCSMCGFLMAGGEQNSKGWILETSSSATKSTWKYIQSRLNTFGKKCTERFSSPYM